MNDLFASAAAADEISRQPLPERMRPQRLADVVGQDHVLGAGGLLDGAVRAGELPSLILWGPPGSGKTTLARLLAGAVDAEMQTVSAVLAGVKELRAAIAWAEELWQTHRRRCVLFVDEIHRFNKAQQDALLPHVENGTVVLVGATTENPSFEVNSALLSRARVLVLNALDEEALGAVLQRSFAEDSALVGLHLEAEARALLVKAADGDARRMLAALESAASLCAARKNDEGSAVITRDDVEQAMQAQWARYDRTDAHYDMASAFIKCMRDSDPDAALYWCFRMLEGGEDPAFLTRRMVIFAAEDVGLADPQALVIANAVREAVHQTGMPEARIPLSMGVCYLAKAAKSKASYKAMHAAVEDVKNFGDLPVPMNLRNAPTKLMQSLGYGEGYVDAHKDPEAAARQAHRPPELEGRVYLAD